MYKCTKYLRPCASAYCIAGTSLDLVTLPARQVPTLRGFSCHYKSAHVAPPPLHPAYPVGSVTCGHAGATSAGCWVRQLERGKTGRGEPAEKSGDLWRGPPGGNVGTVCTSVSWLRGLTPAVDPPPPPAPRCRGLRGRAFWQSPPGLSLERCRVSPHPPSGP